MCSNRIRIDGLRADERTPAKAGLRRRVLLSWSGSRAFQHRVEPGEFSGSANHASAARSVRAAAQARPPMRVLGGGSVDPARRRSPVRPRIREGSLAVDGHARVGVVRSDGGAVPRRRADGRRRRRPAMPLGAGDRPVPGLRVLRAAACGAACAPLSHRAGERRRRAAHLARRRVRP